ncbi:putative membrane protein [Escherichia coli P0304799.3]|nr:putative membrane protein [Escherichia coli P0304799.3]
MKQKGKQINGSGGFVGFICMTGLWFVVWYMSDLLQRYY